MQTGKPLGVGYLSGKGSEGKGRGIGSKEGFLAIDRGQPKEKVQLDLRFFHAGFDQKISCTIVYCDRKRKTDQISLLFHKTELVLFRQGPLVFCAAVPCCL